MSVVSRRLTALVASLLLVLLAGPAEAGGGEALHPTHGRAFVPHLGDWEGVYRGFHASFQLVVNSANSVYGAAGYGIYDLTTSLSTSCPVDPGNFAVLSTGTRKSQVLVSHSGTFPYRQGAKVGELTSATGATVHQSHGGSGAVCLRRMVWHLHPAHRLAVEDGPWSISFKDGEHQRQPVQDDGRVTSLGLPNVAPVCPGGGATAQGSVTVFIQANRRVDQTLHESGGSTLRLLWRFSSSRAGSGRFIAAAPGCTAGTLTFTAHRV